MQYQVTPNTSIATLIPAKAIAQGTSLRCPEDMAPAIAEFDYAFEEDMKARILPDFPGYAFTNTGHVVSFKYGKVKVLSPWSTTKDGYPIVTLLVDGEKRLSTIHRLIALAFVPNPHGKPQVNHIDGNQSNNCADNLEWVTHAENMRHAAKLIASEGRTRQMAPRELLDKAYDLVCSGMRKVDAAHQLGLPYGKVNAVVVRRSRKSPPVAASVGVN